MHFCPGNKKQNDEKLNVIVFENVLINMKIQTCYLSKYIVLIWVLINSVFCSIFPLPILISYLIVFILNSKYM